jgi:hypothetical protein
MRRHHHIFRLLLLVAAFVTSAVASHAQRSDSRSFEHLWTLYDGIRQGYLRDQRAMLDTIGWKAETERNAYHLFIVNYKRLMLDRLYQDKSVQQSVIWLDSLRRDNAAGRWGDRDSLLYRALYHYFIGVQLSDATPNKRQSSTIADATFENMDLWSYENFQNAAREQFFACLDNMPQNVTILTHRWDFMLSGTSSLRELRPTLNDVIFQDILRKFGVQDTTLAIALIDEIMAAHSERNILIDYEIQRLHYRFPDAEGDVDASKAWKTLDSLEQVYGPDIAFDYERGLLFAAADQITDRETDYKTRALDLFEKVIQRRDSIHDPDALTRHYALNAAYYIERLATPSIILSKAQTDLPIGRKLRIPVRYSNLDTVYLTVFKYDYIYITSFQRREHQGNQASEFRYYHYFSSIKKMLERLGEPVHTQRFILPGNGKSRFNTTELWVDSLPIGNYEFFFHLNPTIDSAGLLMSTRFRVTRLKIANWGVHNKAYISVNDVDTGEPLPRMRTKDVIWNTYTNRFGETRTGSSVFSYGDIEIYDHRVVYDVDLDHQCSWSERLFWPLYRLEYYRRYTKGTLPKVFTDRTLYRPGQTVHFKVLLMKKGKVRRNVPVEVYLWGKNWDGVSDTLRLVTSQYGSVEGELTLPQNVGHYTLYASYPNRRKSDYKRDYQTLEVAEYKLPTFKVKLLPDTLQAAAGDSLTIRGTVTALNGLPVSNAAVSLHVRVAGRNDRFEVATERDGSFEYRYPVPFSSDWIRVNIEAIVTDLNGETHSDSTLVILPCQLLKVKISGSNEVDLAAEDTTVWMLRAANFRDIAQAVPIRIRVVRLQAPAEYKIPTFEKEPDFWMPLHSEEEYAREFPYLTFDRHHNSPAYWPASDTVFRTEKVFVPDSLLYVDVKGWRPGDYRIIATAADKSGQEVKATQHFTIYSSQMQEYAPQKPIHLSVVSLPEKTGKPITLSAGSCLRNAVMICDVYQGKKHLKTRRIPLDREQKTFTVKTRATGVRGINLLARIVQNGELHTVSLDTAIQLDTKKIERYFRSYEKLLLNEELTCWRNETEPGSVKHWEITLSNVKQKAVRDAELLVWMFDGSLYELGMEKPTIPIGPHYFAHTKKMPRTFRIRNYNISCSDLSKTYGDYCRYSKCVLEKSVLKYESLQLPYSTYSLPYDLAGRTYSTDIAEVVISWEPPAFSMDMTPSASRLSGENIRTTPGRSVTAALASLEGVSSTNGTMTSVRGNRSDGQEIIVDGVRVHNGPIVTSDTDSDEDTENGRSLSPDVTPRSHFVETAFFYPNLHPDDSGKVHIDFTLPEQYTGWEFYAYGHTKKATMNGLHAVLQSRRTLMLQSNAPRFFREGDTLTLRAKVTNRSESDLDGTVTVEFFNAEDGEPIGMVVNGDGGNAARDGRDAARRVSTDGKSQFSVPAGTSQTVQFLIVVPDGIPAISYRMVARAGNYGDGEERLLPVLPNKMLVTESCPFVVAANTDTAFTFQRYRTHATPTMQPLSYTVEVTTNPAWLAIRALPYLIRYPYDCNEQTFSKLFAAATVQHALEQSPGLDSVFRSWLNDTVNEALASPLLKNESLHTLLLEETPWLRDAQCESQQRRETAELFAAENLKQQVERSLNKLLHNQLSGGGWDWYGRWNYSSYITDHIVAGFYKLQRLGVEMPQADKMLEKAIRAADNQQEERYNRFLKYRQEHPEAQFYLWAEDVHYLYARSFAPYDSVWLSKPYVQNLMTLMTENLEKEKFTRQAEVALVLYRTGDKYAKLEAQRIMEFIRQQSVTDREKGMYWRKEYSGYYYRWYEAPIERQALLIEAFSEIAPRPDELTAMKQWLLMQKEGNSWSNTKATAEAVYALLLGAPQDLLAPAATTVRVGETVITDGPAEAGTGYVQRVWNPESMTKPLADITVRTDSVHPAFGAAYWQYLEVPDQVEATGSGLSVRRTLYHQPAVGDGQTAAPVTADNPIRLGERITVKIVITSDRDLEYVQLKDPRAASFEPVNIHEREGRQQGVRWVESPRDASVCFFFSTFPKGTVVLEYDVFATQTGDFSAGATTVECMYAPEYRAQGDGARVTVR